MDNDPFNNPTCKYCREHKMNVGNEDGEPYLLCGECYKNPVRTPEHIRRIMEEEDDE